MPGGVFSEDLKNGEVLLMGKPQAEATSGCGHTSTSPRTRKPVGKPVLSPEVGPQVEGATRNPGPWIPTPEVVRPGQRGAKEAREGAAVSFGGLVTTVARSSKQGHPRRGSRMEGMRR